MFALTLKVSRILPYSRQAHFRIADYGDHGEGIARIKSKNPLVLPKEVFIPGTLPGEVVEADTFERDGKIFGELKSVEEMSPFRNVKIQCPHYSTCGACSLMHVRYAQQLVLKQQFTTRTFKMAGLGDIPIAPCFPSPRVGFRSTISLVVQDPQHQPRLQQREDIFKDDEEDDEGHDRQKTKKQSVVDYVKNLKSQTPSNTGKTAEEGLRLGYYHKFGSQEVTPISSCVVSVAPINELIPKIKSILHEFPVLRNLRHVTIKATRTPEILVMLSLEGKKKSKRAEKREARKKNKGGRKGDEELKEDPTEDVDARAEALQQFATRIKDASANIVGVFFRVGNEWELLSGSRRTISETICGMKFSLSPGSFFQTNIYQAENIYSRVLEQIRFVDNIVEAYSGVGVLTCLLAKKANEAVGIEFVEEAVADARENAAANSLSEKCNFICGDAEKILPELMEQRKRERKRTDVVVLNPPRTGVKESILECLGEHMPAKIIYISCSAESLAHDISILLSFAHYHVEVEVFDMFPHTMHAEALAVLQLKKRK